MLLGIIFIVVGTFMVAASLFRLLRPPLPASTKADLLGLPSDTDYDTRTLLLLGFVMVAVGYWAIHFDTKLAKFDALQEQQAMAAMEKIENRVQFKEFEGRFTELLDQVKVLNQKLDQVDHNSEVRLLTPENASKDGKQRDSHRVAQQGR